MGTAARPPARTAARVPLSPAGSAAAIKFRGSILFVNGGSGARPNPKVAGTSVGSAGEAAYARMLHDTLAAVGIRAGQLIIPVRHAAWAQPAPTSTVAVMAPSMPAMRPAASPSR